MKSAVHTVARVTTEAPAAKPPPGPGLALNLEFKKRLDARAAEAAPPANSIKEALARWLDEAL